MPEKKSFKLYVDYKEAFDSLTDKQAGQLIKAIFEHESGGEPALVGMLRAVFAPIKNQLDRNQVAYVDTCEKNKANALKRWDATACDRMRTHKDACEAMPKHADTDTDTDTDTDIKNDSPAGESFGQKKFTSPTVEEVAAYCRERCNSVVAQIWHDFYTSKGWMIGKNKMKDWKAAVRTWEKPRETEQSTAHQLPDMRDIVYED